MGTNRTITIGLIYRPWVTAKDNITFVEAVLWIARTGSPLRDLHRELGYWHRIYVRYSRWAKNGV
ncbi:MAG: transposase [Desulfobacterales bacterium]|nr:transposase [Desulfobacterales bacterium]